jgi:heterodisulfide reductase subunit A
VKYIRGRVAELIENPKTKKVAIKAEDTLTRQIIESEFDLVVLSVGLCPSEGTAKIAEILKLAKSPDGFLQEAHPKFRPVDTLTEGVFLAGAVQGPKDIPDTVAQASAASSRAIRLMNKGEYALDPIVAFVHEDLCDGCGLCAGVCPTGAILQTKGAPKISEALCTGCGICLSACPRDALDLHCYTNDQLLAQVEAAVGEARDGHGPIVLVFADDAATYRLADNVGTGKKAYTASARIIRVPSGSRVTPKLMLRAFELGVDGILIGESEEKSSPFPGSAKAIRENVAATRAILEGAGVEPDRIRFLEFVTVMLGKFVGELNGLSEYAGRLGPIPEEKRRLLGKDIEAKLFAAQR